MSPAQCVSLPPGLCPPLPCAPVGGRSRALLLSLCCHDATRSGGPDARGAGSAWRCSRCLPSWTALLTTHCPHTTTHSSLPASGLRASGRAHVRPAASAAIHGRLCLFSILLIFILSQGLGEWPSSLQPAGGRRGPLSRPPCAFLGQQPLPASWTVLRTACPALLIWVLWSSRAWCSQVSSG